MMKKQKDAIGTVISLTCVIAYLYLGFFHMLWHPGWLIFLFIPIFYGIYDFITLRHEMKKDKFYE